MANTHGGANRGQGHKPRPLPKWLAVVRCSVADWQVIRSINPEHRAEILIAWAQANNRLQRTGGDSPTLPELSDPEG